ncbi:MAG: glutamate-5-semialdehyde dehydrogenase [Deltaproteobacteria bacterium]|nr:glutamate-5-semialdehyde dehydrogenase [Deltaproteobacteria bacterium]
MSTTARSLAENARAASAVLARAPSTAKDAALRSMADALLKRESAILAANAEDLRAAEDSGMSGAMLDRLKLDSKRLAGMAQSLREVVALPDPVGEVGEVRLRPNGVRVEKVRIPLGTVLMIYEARPNATAEAAALCVKSGNAVILRGGKEALRSNTAIASALAAGLEAAGLPQGAVQLVPTADRELLQELLQLDAFIDLCIPRGGKGLIEFVGEHARMPVVKHAEGVCHVYVHASADLEMATRIAVNSKAQRPGVCNAAECLLVDRDIADKALPRLGRALADAKVELRADPVSFSVLERAGVPVREAKPEDFGKEFLDLVMAVRVVKDLDGAMEHIAKYGTGHTEAIVTSDYAAARRFAREVIASGVIVNASTRLNDGGQLGLGAEIGISTSRLHAYGPMGLRELTTQKYMVLGDGQIRS